MQNALCFLGFKKKKKIKYLKHFQITYIDSFRKSNNCISYTLLENNHIILTI